MVVTKEMLEKYGAARSILDYFKETFDDKPTEFLEILGAAAPNFELIFLLREHERFSEEEFQQYELVCQVQNSDKIWCSRQIIDSKCVSYSFDVVGSNYVIRSTSVEDSEQVYSSQDVTDSEYVDHSQNVISSNIISDSQIVYHSSYVAQGKDISWSSFIFDSEHLSESNYVYRSENLKRCSCCGFMKNSEDCIFCSGLDGARYQIFNTEVDEDTFLRIKEELQDRLELEETKFFVHKNYGYSYDKTLNGVFNGLSNDFYEWIKTIPGYTEDLKNLVFLSF